VLRLYLKIFLSSNIFENDKVIVPAPATVDFSSIDSSGCAHVSSRPDTMVIPIGHRQEFLHPSRRKPLLLGTPVPVPQNQMAA